MQEFKEPRPNPIAITACRIILPFWLRFKEHLVINVRGDRKDLHAFSRSRRAVILLNHPDRQDPFVIFKIAEHMQEEFYTIAARECFDWDNGWRGKLFQSLGCYSVSRGKADFHCIATTKKILLEGLRKLVVFPEAEITADCYKLHDLQRAVFHIMLDVQEELSEKTDPSDLKNPVVIIPAAIKFSLQGSLEGAVKPALKVMETLLGIKRTARSKAAARIEAVVDAYLSRVFDSYGLEKQKAKLDKLAEGAAVQILEKIASKFEIEYGDELSATEKLYAIRNKAAVHNEVDSVASNKGALKCAGVAQPCILSDFERVERLLVLQRMLLHTDSDIQNCRILDFIESELTGTITPKGWQTCVVTLGTPIDVSAFVEQYSESKEEGVNGLMEHFREKLQGMLRDKKARSTVPKG